MDPEFRAVRGEHVEKQVFSAWPSIRASAVIFTALSGLYTVTAQLREAVGRIDYRDLPHYSAQVLNLAPTGGTLRLAGALI